MATIYEICFIFLSHFIMLSYIKVSALNCSTCLKLTISMDNVPDELEEGLHLMSRIPYTHCQSKRGREDLKTCKSNPFQISTCEDVRMRVKAFQLKNVYQGAKMEQIIHFRQCAQIPIGKTNKCMSIYNADTVTMEEINAFVKVIKRVWNTVIVNGNICYSDNNFDTIPHRMKAQKINTEILKTKPTTTNGYDKLRLIIDTNTSGACRTFQMFCPIIFVILTFFLFTIVTSMK